MKMPSAVILTPSRDDSKSVQPSERESAEFSALVFLFLFILLKVKIYCENCFCLVSHPSPLILTLKPPQLQHHSAALQVVEQTLGGVQGGKVYSVIQHGVHIVPHSWSEQILAAAKEPETGRTEEEEAEKPRTES